MGKFYNDFWECKRINNISKNDPFQAKELYDVYFQKYPFDYITYVYYAMLLLTLNDSQKAEEIIDDIEENKKGIELDLKSEGKIARLDKSLIYAKLKLYSYYNKYYTALNYYIANYEKLMNSKMSIVPFYCRGKLNSLDKSTRDDNIYIYRQIIDYQYDDFFEHIQRHLPDYNVGQQEPNKYLFATDFDIEKIIAEVKKYMPSSLSVFPTFISDNYLFKYDCCGREGYKTTDYFVVVTFHGTKDIITMFPALFYTNIKYVDLNYLKQEKEKPYVRTRSQIDKFNKKYNLK